MEAKVIFLSDDIQMEFYVQSLDYFAIWFVISV